MFLLGPTSKPKKPALDLPLFSVSNIAAGIGLDHQGDLRHNSSWFQISDKTSAHSTHCQTWAFFFKTFETEQEGAKKELTALLVSPSRKKQFCWKILDIFWYSSNSKSSRNFLGRMDFLSKSITLGLQFERWDGDGVGDGIRRCKHCSWHYQQWPKADSS